MNVCTVQPCLWYRLPTMYCISLCCSYLTSLHRYITFVSVLVLVFLPLECCSQCPFNPRPRRRTHSVLLYDLKSDGTPSALSNVRTPASLHELYPPLRVCLIPIRLDGSVNHLCMYITRLHPPPDQSYYQIGQGHIIALTPKSIFI